MCTSGYGCDLHVSAWNFYWVGEIAVSFRYTKKLIKLHSQIDSQSYSRDNACALGLCTGALAAAAISCSRNTLELIQAGLCAIKAAFRTGMRAISVAGRIAPSKTSDRSWSMVVSGSTNAAAAVDEFCKCNVRLALIRTIFTAPIGISGSDFIASLGSIANEEVVCQCHPTERNNSERTARFSSEIQRLCAPQAVESLKAPDQCTISCVAFILSA